MSRSEWLEPTLGVRFTGFEPSVYPDKKEAARTELLNKKHSVAQQSGQRLTMYMSRSERLRASAPGPLDRTKLFTDPQVQDWADLSGRRPTVHGNCADYSPTTVNNNILRSQKQAGFTEALPRDGGPSYAATVLTDNWQEQRRDKSYASGYHAKELGLQGSKYATEYCDNYKPNESAYTQRIYSLYGTAKYPPTAKPAAPQPQGDNETLYYGKPGFGQMPREDHTIKSHRGTYWLGISPYSKESVNSTAMRGQSFEFQKRCPTVEPKAKFLTARVPTDGRLELAYETLGKSQRFTSTWKTTHTTDFTNHGLVPCEPKYPSRQAISR